MKNTIKAIGLLLIVLSIMSCNKQADIPIDHTVYKSSVPIYSDKNDINWKDPALFGGCGFGRAFMSFIRAQNYKTALKFTCQGSIQEHGAANIIKLYQDLKINYTLHQTSENTGNRDTITMRYTTQEYATSKYKDFIIVIERDTCKLVLPHDLNKFLK